MAAKTTVVLAVEVTEGEAQTLELTDYVPDWVFYYESTTVTLRLPKRRMEVPEPRVRVEERAASAPYRFQE
jgi:hypothetical protein